ncbi:MAG: arginine--tRNA ligase [Candidatus Yanofskybacteria bacterium RIFCSPHIGHO2_02_FULL_38_22b]|uniref:Arginine--tRNA ligase n=1 Tax=Candidatus Yanofskybacteria bacterium RIFCSPHIGHO2_02_FULL_38_22b TaxID=1802673 RepID=A0A1F8F1V4_9BACT|nr:MAG: arginine--tRNA ligase [Candidatus Yanofskybacteria bacterium RIFCSPHIGHO2_01_FULL_39_44]OGN06259.1 MAG: arginine--tRNA ligase [Candidatus Yanofskybacteria bacterium RIFCSPHIGHO2_02_FULL_38_22b]OGN19679.1 MAG: arginine--tRNA ligase [Candidatus Yanofskybacteria bacterium RIFCSPLOWO2_01_FULL_39_28]
MKSWLRDKIEEFYPNIDFDILIPPSFASPSHKASEGKLDLGDYSVNLAFVLVKKEKKNPKEVGEELVAKFSKDKEFQKRFSKIELAGGGFINFYLKDDYVRERLVEISKEKDFGYNDEMKGKTVMVEYTDPNPFKLFHIGHLMSNTIGEAIARLYEASGAKVWRVNYQGDVGLHVAKTIWGMNSLPGSKDGVNYAPSEEDSLGKKVGYLGEMYAKGSWAYSSFKEEIEKINQKIYDRSDSKINKLYDLGKKWSLEYFEETYKRLGTKFDHYFFESETGPNGLSIINQNKKIFTESEGALIFKGEDYGVHSRVFINSKGLPTYEAKELGLNKEKFDKYNPDLSIIITGNEINDYFKVLLKVMELVMPEVAQKTRHIGHGMLRLSTGKMSSRTGDVVTADSLIKQTKERLPESEDNIKEKIAIGAIKYSILKQSPGHDIIFDFEKSLSVKGDSAPYIQYTYARLNSIVNKADSYKTLKTIKPEYLNEAVELSLIKNILKFTDVIQESGQELAPQQVALYIYELAVAANRFYEEVRVLKDDNEERRNARLMLVETTAEVLKRGLNLLGIEVLERI